MEQLHAPWRSSYFSTPTHSECIFCTLPAQGPASCENNLILFCNEHVFVMMNRYPYNGGHVMIIPRFHAATLAELPSPDYQATCELLRETPKILAQCLGAQGANIGMNLGKVAGAGIADHCHFHIVPRWQGDTNFMPVVAHTKVLSEDLKATYHKLRPFFQRQ